MSDELDYDKAHDLFVYEPKTGRLIRRISQLGGGPAGSEAGSFDTLGYRRVQVGGKSHKTHRVIWLMNYGKWPKNEIDHIDHDPANNRLNNLRNADRTANGKNQKLSKNNTSGLCGVLWHKRDEVWTARIQNTERFIHLGNFDNLLDAACARKSAEIDHGYHENHGRLV